MTHDQIRQLLTTEAYDFLRDDPHLGKNLMLVTLSGSHAYGTNMENSDVDIRGIAFNSKREILLREDFEQIGERKTDSVIYSFNKAVYLLTKVTPSQLEMLFCRPEDYFYVHPLAQELIANRDMFLSKKILNSFGDYADSQLRKLDNKSMRSLNQAQQMNHILNSIKSAKHSFPDKYFDFDDDAINLYVDTAVQKNYETEVFMDIHLTHYPLRDYKCMWEEMHNIVKEYGKLGKRATNAILHNKINKHAMTLLKLLIDGVDLLKEGEFCTYNTKYHDLLMDVKTGKYMVSNNQMSDEFFEIVNEFKVKLQEAYKTTKLPDAPDKKRIDDFVYKVNEAVVKEQI